MTSKAGRTKVLGALICMGGAVLLIFYKGIPLTNSHSVAATTDILNHSDTMISGKKRQRWVVGSILSLAGCFMWSLWFLIQAKISKSYPFQYSSTALMSSLGAVQSAILSLSIERNLSMWILRTKLEILSVLYAVSILRVAQINCFVGFSWFQLTQEAWNITVSLVHTGNHRIWLVLRWLVMVRQTKGSCVHISIHPLHTDICCHVWFLHPPRTDLSGKVVSFHCMYYAFTLQQITYCSILTVFHFNEQCPGFCPGYTRSVHSTLG